MEATMGGEGGGSDGRRSCGCATTSIGEQEDQLEVEDRGKEVEEKRGKRREEKDVPSASTAITPSSAASSASTDVLLVVFARFDADPFPPVEQRFGPPSYEQQTCSGSSPRKRALRRHAVHAGLIASHRTFLALPAGNGKFGQLAARLDSTAIGKNGREIDAQLAQAEPFARMTLMGGIVVTGGRG